MGPATLRMSQLHVMLILCLMLPSLLPGSLSAHYQLMTMVDGKLEGTVPSSQMLGGHRLIVGSSTRRGRSLWDAGTGWGHPVPINSARKTMRGRPGN